MLKKSIKKSLFRIVLFLVLVLIGINAYILISGRTYLYKGFKETYLKGLSGPTIYDSIVFPYRLAKHDITPVLWPTQSPLVSLTAEEKTLLEKTETTSFLILQNDTIISETYFGKHTVNTRSNSFSMAKSFIALLIGVAVDEGKIKSIDDPINKYLPFVIPGDEGVTIREVMGMSSGLDWSESGSNPFSDNAAAYYTDDLYKVMKNQQFDQKPGKKYHYASGNTELLGMILKEATGKYPTTYFEEKIWSKIGSRKNLLWSLDQKDGIEKAFCCAYATTRDFARIGQLILNKGKWEGKQIISSEMLKEITSPFSSFSPFYGLQFWIFNHPVHPAVYARGILGQYIIVIPTLDVVIVRTGKERKEKYHIPKEQENDTSFVQQNKYKEHHPSDLFDYYTILRHLLIRDK